LNHTSVEGLNGIWKIKFKRHTGKKEFSSPDLAKAWLFETSDNGELSNFLKKAKTIP
jgi:hypothetical protein